MRQALIWYVLAFVTLLLCIVSGFAMVVCIVEPMPEGVDPTVWKAMQVILVGLFSAFLAGQRAFLKKAAKKRNR